jgi:hypothetical protein
MVVAGLPPSEGSFPTSFHSRELQGELAYFASAPDCNFRVALVGHADLVDRLQHQPTALEPQRAHTNRVRSTPRSGAKLEQTLLMNEGKFGRRSAALPLAAPLFSLRIRHLPAVRVHQNGTVFGDQASARS